MPKNKVNNSALTVKKKASKSLPIKDAYAGLPPEHDGRPWYTPPTDFVKPARGPRLPNTKKAPKTFFEQAIREQLAASNLDATETFWRAHARENVKPKYVAERAPNASAFIDEMLQVVVDGQWPTLDDCIPEGSILDSVDRFFWRETDIAREIPFFSVLHYVMAMLMQDGVQIDKLGQMLLPDLYTIILAKSGSGKTMTQKAIAEALGGKVKLFPGADSSIKFAENLENHRLSFFLSDEFGQFLKDVSKEANMKKVRRYLLKAYDNEDISYQTTATDIVVKRPAISLLGLTATGSFTDCMSAEMFLDGFAQRFCFCVAEKDGRRRVANYNFKAFSALVQPLWAALSSTPFHKVYYADDAAMAAYANAFKIITDRADELNIGDDFSRRLAFRCHKYALAYHVLTGKKDNTLHTEDYLFAARLTAMGLRDLRKVFDIYGMNKVVAPNAAVIPGDAGLAGVAQFTSLAATVHSTGHEQFLPRAKEIIMNFASKGRTTNASNMGAYLKEKAVIVHAVLRELAGDPQFEPHIDKKFKTP